MYLNAEIFNACRRNLWDAQRGVFRDAPGLDSYCEHAQAIALMHPEIRDGERSSIIEVLSRKEGTNFEDMTHGLNPVRPFFSHHLFEALAHRGRIDLLFRRLESWQCLRDMDFRTTPETMPGTRSDAHGWSSHPYFHAMASVAGIRPASFGFESVQIRPQPGPLHRFSTRVWSPSGPVEFRAHRTGNEWIFSGQRPSGLAGRLVLPDGSSQAIHGAFEVRTNAAADVTSPR